MEPNVMNYWAILVAGVAYTILGALWYSPALFGNIWIKSIGKTKEQVDKDFSPWKIVGALVTSLIAAYGIARLLTWTSLDPLWGGFGIALLAGICFVFTTMGVNDLMESRPIRLFVLNIVFHIVGFLIMGIIIGLWQ